MKRLFSLPWWAPIGWVPEITPLALKQWLEEGRPLHLVDARTLLEYRQGTLPGARHAPVTGMPASLEALDLSADRPVVVLCLSGHRSRPGVRWLRARGYEAYSLQGGLLNWLRDGYRLTPPETAVGDGTASQG